MLKHTRIIVAFASILALATLVIACGSEPAPRAQPSESTTTNTSAATEPDAPAAPVSGAAGAAVPGAAATQPEVPVSGGAAAPAQPAAPTSQPMVVAPIPAAQPLPVSQPTVVAPTAAPVTAPTAAAEPTVVPAETIDAAAGCPAPPPPPRGLYQPNETTAETDRQALMEMLGEFPNPDDLPTGWATDLPLDRWEGVTTDENGRVTELRIQSESVSFRTLSPLSDLAYLEILDLSDANYGVSFSPGLGNLTRLRVIRMSGFLFSRQSRTIPAELGNLSNLEVLDVGNAGLTGEIPPQLCNLTKLKYLLLGGNNLTGAIPSEMGNLTQLEQMDLRENELTGDIPPELGNLSYLNLIELSENPLTGGIPSELGQLANLGTLNLGGARLGGGIPTELGKLDSLLSLSLGNWVEVGEGEPEFGPTMITGCVPVNLPPDIPYRPSAYDDEGHWYSGVPACSMAPESISPADAAKERAALTAIYNAAQGQSWTANHNWLSDASVKDWFGVTTDDYGYVVGLRLYPGILDKNLKHELSPEIVNLPYVRHLEIIALDDLVVPNDVLTQMGSLSHLESLVILGGGTDGGIPPELGNLSNLKGFSLALNDLTGEIPSALGNLTGLQALYLFGNDLTGEIPSELANLKDLRGLLLQGNRLSGPVPPWLGSLGQLSYLHLARQ